MQKISVKEFVKILENKMYTDQKVFISMTCGKVSMVIVKEIFEDVRSDNDGVEIVVGNDNGISIPANAQIEWQYNDEFLMTSYYISYSNVKIEVGLWDE